MKVIKLNRKKFNAFFNDIIVSLEICKKNGNASFDINF